MAKSYNDDTFITTQVWQHTMWKDEKKSSRKITFNLLNNDGFIVFMQKYDPEGEKGKKFPNICNYYIKMENLRRLKTLIDIVLDDIAEKNFTKDRFIEGNKSNLYLLCKEVDDRLLVMFRIVLKDEDGKLDSKKSQCYLDENMNESLEKFEAVMELEELRDTIAKIADGSSIKLENHFKKYFASKDGNKNSKSSSNSSNDNDFDDEDDEFPF